VECEEAIPLEAKTRIKFLGLGALSNYTETNYYENEANLNGHRSGGSSLREWNGAEIWAH
jgi:hypothetical protein